jgi:hypothetical protein
LEADITIVVGFKSKVSNLKILQDLDQFMEEHIKSGELIFYFIGLPKGNDLAGIVLNKKGMQTMELEEHEKIE